MNQALGLLLNVFDENDTIRHQALFAAISSRKFLVLTITIDGVHARWEWHHIESYPDTTLSLHEHCKLSFGQGAISVPEEIFEELGRDPSGLFVEPIENYRNRP